MMRGGLVLALVFLAPSLGAQPVGQNDVSSTVHNFSVTGTGGVLATSENQVCVFCHTPHGANNFPGSPLWNRSLSGGLYDTYRSESLDTQDLDGPLAQPAGSSRLCLSCHDGTLAVSAVTAYRGQQNETIPMTGLGPGDTMPVGAGDQTGNTRRLGQDLTNDHPISFTYDTTLAQTDGELWDPDAVPRIGLKLPGVPSPQFPLQPTGAGGEAQMQCSSCHDPHLDGTDMGASLKFLRGRRFQQTDPLPDSYADSTDMVCLGCHRKEGWANSAHAVPEVANETYTATGAANREFPAGIAVWQAGCLNCHDAHTVHGARRLLREATDSLAQPKSGGNPALEENCYQCHSPSGQSIINDPAGSVPDIQTEFALGFRMPITTADQPATEEIHAIEDADGTEPRGQLGLSNDANRHAECSDCHNPHRLMRNTRYDGTGGSASATHDHSEVHGNDASGALRGTWGVEPNFGSTVFGSLPTSYSVLRGDPAVALDPVTREYQVCLKCHSDYAYPDSGAFPSGGRPRLGSFVGGTGFGFNGLTEYTNQAMEFQAPLADRGEPGGNHRSWHPVLDDTGRDASARSMTNTANMFVAPWTSAGIQEMLCSDCHGRNTANNTVEPPAGRPWGPHGSENEFLLKGRWDNTSGDNSSALCFRCHNFEAYATETNDGDEAGFESGFGGPDRDTNLHALHAKEIGRNLRCSWCHAAVPHGFKNKALLVNLNDVGSEAGTNGIDFNAVSGEIAINANGESFSAEPYYLNAKLKVINWRASGTWRDIDCGSEGSNGTNNDQQIGKDWMNDVCSNPP